MGDAQPAQVGDDRHFATLVWNPPCEEVAKLRIALRRPGNSLPATNANSAKSAASASSRATGFATLTPRRGPFNLYDLVADDNRAALIDRGVIPWWSEPNLTVRFLRPLPSLLVWADHRLFGNETFGPHVLSFLWWVAAVPAAHVLYRTTLGKRATWIGTVVFALSPSLVVPLVWLANRAGLVSLTFGSLGPCALRSLEGRQKSRPGAGDRWRVRRSCSDRRIRALPPGLPGRL